MRRATIIASLLPLLIPFLAVFGCGLAITGLQSFGLMMFSYSYDDLLFGYRELFADSWFLESLLFSLYVSLVASLSSVVFGTVLATCIWRLPSRYHGWTIVYKLPLVLPHIAVGFIAVILLSKTGVLASLCHWLGLITTFKEFPDLLYTRSGIDLIVAYVYKETPFVMVMVYAMLCRYDQKQVDTAKMLGGGEMRIFFSLVLPFILPVVNTTFIILFVFTFGGFDLPFVLGDSQPGMVSIRIYDYFFQRDIALRPVAMAMLTIVFLFSLAFMLGYLRLSAKIERGVRKI